MAHGAGVGCVCVGPGLFTCMSIHTSRITSAVCRGCGVVCMLSWQASSHKVTNVFGLLSPVHPGTSIYVLNAIVQMPQAAGMSVNNNGAAQPPGKPNALPQQLTSHTAQTPIKPLVLGRSLRYTVHGM